MGAPRKFKSGRAFRKAVEAYFDGITREKNVTEKVPTGQLDKYGHVVYEEREVTNRLGQPVTVTQFLVPPSWGDLAEALGVHRSTLTAYLDEAEYPEFSDTARWARGRIHAYLERESLTREGKDLKGVIFNLENNFGYSEKVDVQSGVEEFLRRCAESEDGGQRF